MGRRYRRYRGYGGSRSSSNAGLLVAGALLLYFFVRQYWWVFLLAAAIGVTLFVIKIKNYRNGAYYQVTKNAYLSVLTNKGRYGEYLTYDQLKHFESQGAKFLFNVYIPKENGETTEIDVLMISSKGIFVFESKNYSGWIFGSEKQTHWYQTLPSGRKSHKESFYNPVMQNATHIKHLKALLGDQTPTHSVIVFSERCKLKSVEIQSKNIRVINRQDIASVVDDIYDQTSADLLDKERIFHIYNVLYPYTQVDDHTKAKHVENIQNNVSGDAVKKDVLPSGGPTVEVTVQEERESAQEIRVAAAETPPAAEEAKPAQEVLLKPQEQICPWCKGRLILRTATRGVNAGNQFYGCTNYPKCRFTKAVTKQR